MAWNIRQFIHNKLKTVNFSSDLTQVSPWGTSKWSHTDIPRLVRGQIGAQVGIRNGAIQISNSKEIKLSQHSFISVSQFKINFNCRIKIVKV